MRMKVQGRIMQKHFIEINQIVAKIRSDTALKIVRPGINNKNLFNQ